MSFTAEHHANPEAMLAAHDLALVTGRIVTWQWDPDTGSVEWSADPSAALGLALEPGQSPVSLLVTPVTVAVAAGAPWEDYQLDRHLPAAGGSAIDVVVRAKPLPRLPGQPACIVGVVVDVTDRAGADRELRDLVDRYRLLLDLSPDAVVVHEQGRLRYVNPAGLRFLGTTKVEDVIDRLMLDFVDPRSRAALVERISGLDVDGAVSSPAELIIRSVDGGQMILESTSVRTRWQGRPAYQVILRDTSTRRRAEAVTRHQASLVAHVTDAIISCDSQGLVESWNPAAARLYGWPVDEVLGLRLSDVLGEEALDEDGRLRGGHATHTRRNGSSVRVNVSDAPVTDAAGIETGLVAVVSEETSRQRARRERDEAEARYTAVVESLDEGIVVVGDDGAVRSMNASARRLLPGVEVGVGGRELFDRHRIVHPDGRVMQIDEHPVARVQLTGAAEAGVELGVVLDGGRIRWLRVNAQPLLVADDHPSVVCSFADITALREAADQLGHQASHDVLTGLPNRARFLDGLAGALLAAKEVGHDVGVIFVDLDRFKAVNDSLGHLLADEVMVHVARAIRTGAGDNAMVARLAGDEFVVLLPVATRSSARQVALSVGALVAQPVVVSSGRSVRVTASLGVAMAAGTVDALEVLRDADVAMFRAKQRGRSRIQEFDEDLRASARRRLDIEDGLRSALDEQTFQVHHQPIASLSTGRIAGVEALARWPDRSISPAEFIPVAEDTGLIVPLGAQVLRMACADAARWRISHPGLHVAVNLSARQLADAALPAHVGAILAETGLAPDALWLEVTESVLMDAEPGGQALARLREIGVHLAIDDFGTGYSSLSYLKRLPVQTVKIDRSFVDGLGTDPEDEAIVAAVISLAHALHLEVVAEGVESVVQLQHLVRLGCDFAQGYLLAEPRPAASVDLDAILPGCAEDRSAG